MAAPWVSPKDLRPGRAEDPPGLPTVEKGLDSNYDPIASASTSTNVHEPDARQELGGGPRHPLLRRPRPAATLAMRPPPAGPRTGALLSRIFRPRGVLKSWVWDAELFFVLPSSRARMCTCMYTLRRSCGKGSVSAWHPLQILYVINFYITFGIHNRGWIKEVWR